MYCAVSLNQAHATRVIDSVAVGRADVVNVDSIECVLDCVVVGDSGVFDVVDCDPQDPGVDSQDWNIPDEEPELDRWALDELSAGELELNEDLEELELDELEDDDGGIVI